MFPTMFTPEKYDDTLQLKHSQIKSFWNCCSPAGVPSNSRRPTVPGCFWRVVPVPVRRLIWRRRFFTLWSVSPSTAWTLPCCSGSAAPPQRRPAPRWLLRKHHTHVDGCWFKLYRFCFWSNWWNNLLFKSVDKHVYGPFLCSWWFYRGLNFI